MALWRWVRAVVADRGEDDPVPVHLERADGGRGYVFRLGLRAGIGGQQTARIEVASRLNPAPHPILKEIHYCEVAGRTLEAANVHALREKVAHLLDGIAPARVLPLCYFRAPSADYDVAVYEQGGGIAAPVIGGPKLKADDLAGIRHVVCRYLTSAGYVHEADEVEVGVLRPRDLRRVPPAATFVSSADPRVWLPSVEGASDEGPVVGLLASSPTLLTTERRRAGPIPPALEAAPAAPDVVTLLRLVQADLRSSRRAVVDPATLYAAKVRPEIWREAESRLEDGGATLVAHLSDDEATRLELRILRTGAGDVAVALEDRGINVFLAPDENALLSAVGSHLSAHGFLRFDHEIRVETPPEERVDRLDAGSISRDLDRDWGPAAGATSDEAQEVQLT